MVGPESYVAPLRQLDGLDMESGRTPEGKRPTIEKFDQVYSNILDGTAEYQSPQLLLREACDQAMTEGRSVTIPPAGEAAAVPYGPRQRTGVRSDNLFGADGPAILMPPPPQEGEGAPPLGSEADSDDDDGLGGLCVDDEPAAIDGRDPQRDSRPDEDKYQKLGLAHIEYRLDRQSNFSAAKPREK
eukprot:8729019-Pyramimonas_sp.AAC.1